MNIFIDTSVLYPNPFWRGNFSQRLLEVVRNGRAKLYLSEVVLRELKHNYEKNFDKDIYDLKKLNSSLRNNLRRFREFELPDKEQSLKDFNDFYSDLEKYGKVEILKCDDNLLHPLLERAIKREKPFTEKKTELKDALIWLTYSRFINENDLKGCFLLTNNVTDFCEADKLKNKIFDLHPTLKKECDRISIFTNFKDFYQSNSSYLDKPQRELEEWISNIDFDDKYVFTLLWDNEGNSIADKVYDLSDKINPDNLFDEGYLVSMGGYLDIGGIEWYECKDTEIEIVSDYAIVSGVLVVNAEVECYMYNSVRDKGEDKYQSIGSNEIEVELFFTFTIEKDGTPENFEITDAITE